MALGQPGRPLLFARRDDREARQPPLDEQFAPRPRDADRRMRKSPRVLDCRGRQVRIDIGRKQAWLTYHIARQAHAAVGGLHPLVGRAGPATHVSKRYAAAKSVLLGDGDRCAANHIPLAVPEPLAGPP